MGRPADNIVHLQNVGRDIGFATVDGDVAMTYDLPPLIAGLGETQAIDDVVQPHLQQAQEIVAGDPLPAHRLLVVAPELSLQHAIGSAALLLLP